MKLDMTVNQAIGILDALRFTSADALSVFLNQLDDEQLSMIANHLDAIQDIPIIVHEPVANDNRRYSMIDAIKNAAYV